MARYLIRRLAGLVLVLFSLSVFVFLLMRLIPGDPAEVIAGMGATREEVETIRDKLGLNLPVHIQYIRWLGSILRGELGRSAITGQPIADMIKFRIWNTFKLALAGIFLASVFGITAGVISAVKQNTVVDYLITSCSVLGISMPVFWIGMLLVLLFSIKLGFLPAGGTGGIRYLVLPAVTIAANSVPIVARMTRSSMLEVLRKDYIRTAKAKGLHYIDVIAKHGLRNAAIPILTIIGLQFGMLMGGAVLTESVFDWSGIGRLIVDAVFKRDYPLVQVLLLTFGAGFALTNLVVDMLYPLIDPRVRYE